jgi:hypothetical protein
MVSSFSFIPGAQLCVVTLTNSDPNYDLHRAGDRWVVEHMLGLADIDFIAKFTEHVEQQKSRETEREEQHKAAANPAVKPSLPLASFVGTYSNETFGDLVVSYNNRKLRFAYGSVYVGTLAHHRGDSFDLINDKAERIGELINLSFTVDGESNVESVLMTHSDGSMRFTAQSKEQK